MRKLNNTWSEKGWKVTVGNLACLFKNGGSLKITFTVPLMIFMISTEEIDSGLCTWCSTILV